MIFLLFSWDFGGRIEAAFVRRNLIIPSRTIILQGWVSDTVGLSCPKNRTLKI